jgi:hypothetical protein
MVTLTSSFPINVSICLLSFARAVLVHLQLASLVVIIERSNGVIVIRIMRDGEIGCVQRIVVATTPKLDLKNITSNSNGMYNKYKYFSTNIK